MDADSQIDALRTGRLTDPQTPGLLLEYLPSGKKIFRYTRRVPASKRIHKDTLGPWPAYRIVEAREWAQAIPNGLSLSVNLGRGSNPFSRAISSFNASFSVFSDDFSAVSVATAS
ncbi:Arm DNA-binding domain-containing protein [Sphingomonas sp. RT2P30]